MLNEPTIDQLQALRLPGMLTAWQEQQRQADLASLGFDERFALLVEAEWRRRENERLGRHLRAAKLCLTLVLAGLATPLVLSLHSIVSMDCAVSQLPGWHSTIFPPDLMDLTDEHWASSVPARARTDLTG